MSYSCAAPPADLAGCSIDADCTTVALGCYCGAQPVNGVASKYAAAAQACQEAAASTCALGCANEIGEIAQDGTKAAPGTVFAARCNHSGAVGVCQSFMMTATPSDGGFGGGSGEPTGW